MRSTLVFKNIREEHHETWEDTCKTLSHFIISELNAPYPYDDIDLLISRAHRSAENQEDLEEHQRKNLKGSKPIFAQFTNWTVAEEIRNKIVMLNAKKQTKSIGEPDVFKRPYYPKKQCPKKTTPTFKQCRQQFRYKINIPGHSEKQTKRLERQVGNSGDSLTLRVEEH